MFWHTLLIHLLRVPRQSVILLFSVYVRSVTLPFKFALLRLDSVAAGMTGTILFSSHPVQKLTRSHPENDHKNMRVFKWRHIQTQQNCGTARHVRPLHFSMTPVRPLPDIPLKFNLAHYFSLCSYDCFFVPHSYTSI